MFSDTFINFNFLLVIIVSIYCISLIFLLYLKRARLKEKHEKLIYTVEFCLKDDRKYINKMEFYQSKSNSYNTEVGLESFLRETYYENLDFLEYFDKISIGISRNVFDEETIRQYYSKYFIFYYELLKYPIMKNRNDLEQPYLFIEYEKIVNKWKSVDVEV